MCIEREKNKANATKMLTFGKSRQRAFENSL